MFQSIPDDVTGHFDATDAAHPAWWRAHDYVFRVAARRVLEILETPTRFMREGGINAKSWHDAQVRIATLAINVGCMREDRDKAQAEVRDLRAQLAEAKRALEVFAARAHRETRG